LKQNWYKSFGVAEEECIQTLSCDFMHLTASVIDVSLGYLRDPVPIILKVENESKKIILLKFYFKQYRSISINNFFFQFWFLFFRNGNFTKKHFFHFFFFFY